ncbi:hypothetical protein GCM10023083_09420 [Streptomyces phyllanthi]
MGHSPLYAKLADPGTHVMALEILYDLLALQQCGFQFDYHLVKLLLELCQGIVPHEMERSRNTGDHATQPRCEMGDHHNGDDRFLSEDDFLSRAGAGVMGKIDEKVGPDDPMAIHPEHFHVRNGAVVNRIRHLPGLVEPNTVAGADLSDRIRNLKQLIPLAGIQSGESRCKICVKGIAVRLLDN